MVVLMFPQFGSGDFARAFDVALAPGDAVCAAVNEIPFRSWMNKVPDSCETTWKRDLEACSDSDLYVCLCSFL